MPQPKAVTDSSAELIRLLTASADRIAAEQTRLLGLATSTNRAARLRELQATVTRERQRITELTSGWIQQQLPGIYARGGLDSGVVDVWTWTQIHRQALEQISGDTFDAVLSATTFMDADAKRWIREASRAVTASAIIEGRTPQQIARALRDAAPRAIGVNGEALPLKVIRYSNGTKMPAAPYFSMLTRTQTALAYNGGSLNTMAETGLKTVRILDGTDCGLASHDDGRKANGRIVPIDQAYLYPIAHPQCRRAFSHPGATIPNERRADQTAFEKTPAASSRIGREARSGGRSGRSGRQGRLGETPRTPRTARRAEPVAQVGPLGDRPSARVNYANKRARTQYEDLVTKLDAVHGLAPDGLDATDLIWKTSSKSGGKGGHFTPAGSSVTRPRRKRRFKSEADRDAYNARVKTYNDAPVRPEVMVIDKPGNLEWQNNFLHEFGHRTDWDNDLTEGLTRGRVRQGEYVSRRTANQVISGITPDSPAMADFLAAVTDTDTVRSIADTRAPFKFKQYLRDPAELWARSYSQWAAEAIGDADSIAAAVKVREALPHFLWSPKEMGTIGRLIEAVLRERGLMS